MVWNKLRESTNPWTNGLNGYLQEIFAIHWHLLSGRIRWNLEYTVIHGYLLEYFRWTYVLWQKPMESSGTHLNIMEYTAIHLYLQESFRWTSDLWQKPMDSRIHCNPWVVSTGSFQMNICSVAGCSGSSLTHLNTLEYTGIHWNTLEYTGMVWNGLE